MWKFLFQIILISLAAFLGFVGCSSINKPVTHSWLPGDGEAASGRKTFVEMGCFTCHAVADPGIPEPVSSRPFRIPLNSEVRNAPAHEIAAAIINPLHLTPEDKESSPLGDYAEILTVQQLTDLVAYLKELND